MHVPPVLIMASLMPQACVGLLRWAFYDGAELLVPVNLPSAAVAAAAPTMPALMRACILVKEAAMSCDAILPMGSEQ